MKIRYKVYQNRKIYDMIDTCYVTLDEMLYGLFEDPEYSVIENKTGTNITFPMIAKAAYTRYKGKFEFQQMLHDYAQLKLGDKCNK